MKVERFTAENSALLLIDHQVGTMKLIKNIDKDMAAKQSIALAKMAKILNLPVVITSSQEENAQGPILPEIANILPEAFAARVKRPGVVNAWAYEDFRKAVLATGRKNLIMAGVTTDVCLIFPAIDAPRIMSTRHPRSFNTSAKPKSGADPYPPPTRSALTGSAGIPKLTPRGPTISTWS